MEYEYKYVVIYDHSSAWELTDLLEQGWEIDRTTTTTSVHYLLKREKQRPIKSAPVKKDEVVITSIPYQPLDVDDIPF